MATKFEGKISLGTNVTPMPMPSSILLVKSKNGDINCMALSWFCRLNAKPAEFGIAINKVHKTHAILEEGQGFSLNFPSADQVGLHDACGLLSGKKIDKSGIWDIGETDQGIPIALNCKYSIVLLQKDKIEHPTNTFFIGEVVDSFANEDAMDGKALDVAKVDPFVLTMPDNRYWRLGESIGKAWGCGVDEKKRILKEAKEKAETKE